jgi:cell division protein FtsB
MPMDKSVLYTPEALENELSAIRTERQRYERKTVQMNGPVRDEDLIEEQARTVLDFAHPDDIVLIRPARACHEAAAPALS